VVSGAIYGVIIGGTLFFSSPLTNVDNQGSEHVVYLDPLEFEKTGKISPTTISRGTCFRLRMATDVPRRWDCSRTPGPFPQARPAWDKRKSKESMSTNSIGNRHRVEHSRMEL
jgi:hypothetical protein